MIEIEGLATLLLIVCVIFFHVRSEKSNRENRIVRRVSYMTMSESKKMISQSARRFRRSSRLEDIVLYKPKKPSNKSVIRTLSLKTV